MKTVLLFLAEHILFMTIIAALSIYAFIAVLRLKRKVKKLQRTIEQMQKNGQNTSAAPNTTL